MPFFFDAYPYTNFHNVNLDWVLQAVKAWGKTVEKNDELYTELNAAFNDFKKFVQDYLAELDVSEEIDAKLDQMLEDGTLTPYFAPYIQNYTQQYVNEWLGSHVDPSAPALDNTLTLTNGAAQAAAAGRRLGEAAYFAFWETPHDYTYIKLADVIPGYRLNSIAYDYNGHYYACGGSRAKNGMGFIAVMSKPDFSDAVVTEIPGLGHANDITYDNGYLYVCTANDDGASEGGAPLNAIVKIKADDFNNRTVISNCPENTIGICYVRQGFWILAPYRIYRTTDFTSYTLVVSNIYAMMESYGLTSEGRLVQSLYRSPGNMPALVCAFVRDGSHYGAITFFDHDSGEAVGFKTFESYQGEVEGAVYGEGTTWIVTDSSGGGATILRSDLLRQRYNLLATGDDLNDIVSDSISYCTGSNVAAGVLHGPVSDTGYTVFTYRQGLYNTTQVASDNRGHFWHRYRSYTSGSWREWEELGGAAAAPDLIMYTIISTNSATCNYTAAEVLSLLLDNPYIDIFMDIDGYLTASLRALYPNHNTLEVQGINIGISGSILIARTYRITHDLVNDTVSLTIGTRLVS